MAHNRGPLSFFLLRRRRLSSVDEKFLNGGQGTGVVVHGRWRGIRIFDRLNKVFDPIQVPREFQRDVRGFVIQQPSQKISRDDQVGSDGRFRQLRFILQPSDVIIPVGDERVIFEAR